MRSRLDICAFHMVWGNKLQAWLIKYSVTQWPHYTQNTKLMINFDTYTVEAKVCELYTLIFLFEA